MTSSSGASAGPVDVVVGAERWGQAVGHGPRILELRRAVGDIEFVILLLAAAAVLVRLADRIARPVPDRARRRRARDRPDPRAARPRARARRRLPRLPAAAAARRRLELVAARAAGRDARRSRCSRSGSCSSTMGAVAVVAHAIVPGMSWEAAFVLGAIVGPTDPVSATATFSRIGAPRARAPARRGRGDDQRRHRARRLPGRARRGGGGHVLVRRRAARVRRTARRAASRSGSPSAGWASQIIRRQSDVSLSIFVSVIAAYGAYIVAEEAHVSGVLAAVAAGIFGGWNAHSAIDAGTRLSAIAFWGVMTFGLEAMLFVLLGLQAPLVADEVDIARARAAGGRRRRRGDRGADAVTVGLGRVHRRRRCASAIAVGWAGHARRDLARRGARGPTRGRRAPGDPPAHVRRDRRSRCSGRA